MKRSASESATPPSSLLVTPKSEGRDTEYTPSDPPSPSPVAKKPRAITTPKRPRARATGTPSSGAKKDLASKRDWEAGWSPDKKEAIIERLLGVGIKNVNLADLCRDYNLTKTQLGNQLQTGHKNNLRDKAAKGAR